MTDRMVRLTVSQATAGRRERSAPRDPWPAGWTNRAVDLVLMNAKGGTHTHAGSDHAYRHVVRQADLTGVSINHGAVVMVGTRRSRCSHDVADRTHPTECTGRIVNPIVVNQTASASRSFVYVFISRRSGNLTDHGEPDR